MQRPDNYKLSRKQCAGNVPSSNLLHDTCADPEGGGGNMESGPPLKNHKNIEFHSNTDPLKNHKATKPAFNVVPSSARQRNTI